MSFSHNIYKLDGRDRKYKIGILNYVLNTSDEIKKLDFIGILNSILNKKIKSELKEYEIFAYGISKKKEYDDVFYIVND